MQHRLHKSDKLADLYGKYEHKMQLEEQCNQLRLDIKNASQVGPQSSVVASVPFAALDRLPLRLVLWVAIRCCSLLREPFESAGCSGSAIV